MTAQNPPIYLQGGSHPAEDVRRFHAALTGDSEGIIYPGDLSVTQSATPAMSVSVAGGRAFIRGDSSTYQGTYFVENRGATTLVVPASDPVNGRIDLVVARVRDSVYSGATNEWALELIAGTPAASPVEPSTPDGALPLATIVVGASVSSITNANIADRRTTAYLHTGTAICTSNTRPSSPFEGMTAYEIDTNRHIIWNGTWRQTNWVAHEVLTSGQTSSSSFTDILGVGPNISLLTGTSALIHVHAQMGNTGAGGAVIGVAVSGASTIAANDDDALYVANAFSAGGAFSGLLLVSGLTAGVNTFTMKYKAVGNTATFQRRRMSGVAII